MKSSLVIFLVGAATVFGSTTVEKAYKEYPYEKPTEAHPKKQWDDIASLQKPAFPVSRSMKYLPTKHKDRIENPHRQRHVIEYPRKKLKNDLEHQTRRQRQGAEYSHKKERDDIGYPTWMQAGKEYPPKEPKSQELDYLPFNLRVSEEYSPKKVMGGEGIESPPKKETDGTSNEMGYLSRRKPSFGIEFPPRRQGDGIEFPPLKETYGSKYHAKKPRNEMGDLSKRKPSFGIEYPPMRQGNYTEHPRKRPRDHKQYPHEEPKRLVEYSPKNPRYGQKYSFERVNIDGESVDPRKHWEHDEENRHMRRGKEFRIQPKGDVYPKCSRPGAWCQWNAPNEFPVADVLREKLFRALKSEGKRSKVRGFMFAYRKKHHHGHDYAMVYQQPPFKGYLHSCVIAFYEDTQGKEHMYPDSFFCVKGYENTNNRLIEWVLEGKPIPGEYSAEGE